MFSQMKYQSNYSLLQASEWKCQKHLNSRLLYISTVQNSFGCVFKCEKCKSEEQISQKDLISISQVFKDPSPSTEEIKSSLKWIFKGEDQFFKEVAQLQFNQTYPNNQTNFIRNFIASTKVELNKLLDIIQSKFEAQSMELYKSDQNNLNNLKSYVSTANAKLREALRDSQASEKVREFFSQLATNEKDQLEQNKKNIKESIQQKKTLEKELPKIIQNEILVKLNELAKVIDGNIQNLEFKVSQIGQQSLSDFNMDLEKFQEKNDDNQIPQNTVCSTNQAVCTPSIDPFNQVAITPSGESSNEAIPNLSSQPINEFSRILQFIHSKYSRNDTPFFQSPIQVDSILKEEYLHNQASFEQVQALFKKQNIFSVSKVRGDGNCFFRSFFIGYMLSKIASMKDPVQEIPQFLNALQQISIQNPTKAEEVFGKDYEVSLLVNASLSYFGEQMNILAQKENRIKFLSDLFNNAAFDFAMQILCKSMIVQAAKEIVEKKIEPLYLFIDQQVILSSVQPLNSENGSTEIFGFLATYLNTELVIVSCKKDEKKESEIFSPTQGLPDSPLMLPLNTQGKPQQLALWFKVGHYYLAYTKEQINNLKNKNNQI